jgi:hypothetical protein
MNSYFTEEDTIYASGDDSGGDPALQDLVDKMTDYCTTHSTTSDACACFDSVRLIVASHNDEYNNWLEKKHTDDSDYTQRMAAYNAQYNSTKAQLDGTVIPIPSGVSSGPDICSNPMYKCVTTTVSESGSSATKILSIGYSDQYIKDQLDQIPVPQKNPEDPQPTFNPSINCCSNTINGGATQIFQDIVQKCEIKGGGKTDPTGSGTGQTGSGTGQTGSGTGQTGGKDKDDTNKANTSTTTDNNRTKIIIIVVSVLVVFFFILLLAAIFYYYYMK